MTCVDRVKALCKERKIAISKLEKDLGFGNGYIGQLRRGVFPADRLIAIAKYLGVSVSYLMEEEKPTEKPGELSQEEIKFIDWYRNHASEKEKALVKMIVDGGA